MADPAPSKALTYSRYLKLDELLELQQPLSEGPEHDEILFIVIHQVYELWFKEILHELDHLERMLLANDAPHALGTLKRILTILKTLVAQIDVLETMSPVSFLSFRSRLESASGFQSAQFRQLEFRLGRKRAAVLSQHPADSRGGRALAHDLGRPSLWHVFLGFLSARGYPVPTPLLQPDVERSVAPSPEVQELLLDVYRNDHLVEMLCERLVDLDEGIQEWRYRHVKMVERTIGTKHGTGGSEGAEYLKTTLFEPLFPDLWAIRARL